MYSSVPEGCTTTKEVVRCHDSAEDLCFRTTGGSWQNPDYCPCVLNAGIILGNKWKNRFDGSFRFLRHSTFFFTYSLKFFVKGTNTNHNCVASLSPTSFRFTVIKSTLLHWCLCPVIATNSTHKTLDIRTASLYLNTDAQQASKTSYMVHIADE